MAKFTKKEALNYHSEGRPGKIEVIPTKPYATQRDLSLAYTPGVAQPCLEIQKNPEDVFKYTAKGNLVAVISNGTAVLGLGDIGTEAGKPVMEGKGLLFKVFADVDVFDIEIESKDVETCIQTIKQIAPTFGGINLEDIKAPECFEIEERLKKELDIPVMHDDQHGTAIISAAGMLNALELAGKKIDEVTMVVNGAGASAIACTNLYVAMGMKKENIIMLDSKGVLRKDRTNLNKYKQQYVTDKDLTSLEDAVKGADVFLGLSVADVLSQDMVRSMADNPIVFAMANPNPEITYDDAVAARDDVIMATGRSDYPNQVNNVLGFPFIFRGALDVRATAINEEMKIAAAKALADLAKKDVPEIVNTAYQENNIVFGRQYFIPKPLDPRLVSTIAPAVAKAAMETGVARIEINDWNQYVEELNKRMGLGNKLIDSIQSKAKRAPKRVVYTEGHNFKILKAAQIALHEGIAEPVLMGNRKHIERVIKENELDLKDIEIIEHHCEDECERRKEFAKLFFEKRQRKGITYDEALEKMLDRNYFATMLVETGYVDAMISGIAGKYIDTINPAREIVGTEPDIDTLAAMFIMKTKKKGTFFLADTTVNVKPDAETLVEIVLLTAAQVRKFNIEPVIAMVSFSNFGSTVGEGSPERIIKAIEILHRDHPDLIVDGEIQANFALNKELRQKKFPFCKLGERDVNTLIFPNATSGSVTYKIMQEIGDAEALGPILIGTKKPVHIIPIGSSVRHIVNMTAISVIDAQEG